jgi:hypothetical protein
VDECKPLIMGNHEMIETILEVVTGHGAQAGRAVLSSPPHFEPQ